MDADDFCIGNDITDKNNLLLNVILNQAKYFIELGNYDLSSQCLDDVVMAASKLNVNLDNLPNRFKIFMAGKMHDFCLSYARQYFQSFHYNLAEAWLEEASKYAKIADINESRILVTRRYYCEKIIPGSRLTLDG